MYRILALSVPLLLAGCASMDEEAAISTPNLQGDSEAQASLTYVREVDLKPTPYSEELICEMVAVTGTRIAEERCYPRSQLVGDEQAREEQIDSLRRGQLLLEQKYLESVTFPTTPCGGKGC